MQIGQDQSYGSIGAGKERVELALARLKSYRCKVSELRAQCETLKKMRSEQKEDLLCRQCGKPIDKDQKVTLRDSDGKVKGVCHKDCFEEIWRSQDWTFNYSYPRTPKPSREGY